MEPAVKIARRLIAKNKLSPPVDIRTLVKEYASVEYAPFPIEDVDGVCVDLKRPGRKARVIVNSRTPESRQTFTLAHELGHLCIPWHIGTIFDELDPELLVSGGESDVENEANHFAAELLMPFDWLEMLLKKQKDLSRATATISDACKVSTLAAAIRMADVLPPHYVYCAVQRDKVLFSGRTPGTLAKIPPWDSDFDDEAYRYAEAHFSTTINGRTIHWWRLPRGVVVTGDDPRAWRDILNELVDDLGYSGTDAADIKKSINGVLAYGNSVVKRQPGYGPEAIVAAALQRLHDRPEYSDVVSHPDFLTFLKKKADELAARNA